MAYRGHHPLHAEHDLEKAKNVELLLYAFVADNKFFVLQKLIAMRPNIWNCSDII